MGKFFLLFTIVPFVELWLMLQIGDRLGVVPTLALIIGTGLLGAALAKREGLRVWKQWQAALAEGRLPADGVLSGLLVLVGGVLLITPGVLSDLAGVLLMLPFTRRPIAAWLRRRIERQIARGARGVTFQSVVFPGPGSGDARGAHPSAGAGPSRAADALGGPVIDVGTEPDPPASGKPR